MWELTPDIGKMRSSSEKLAPLPPVNFLPQTKNSLVNLTMGKKSSILFIGLFQQVKLGKFPLLVKKILLMTWVFEYPQHPPYSEN